MAIQFLRTLLTSSAAHPRMAAVQIAVEAVGEAIMGGFRKGPTDEYFEWHRPWYMAIRALGGVNPELAERLVAEELHRRSISKNPDAVAQALLLGSKLTGEEPLHLEWNAEHRTLRLETDLEAAERLLAKLVSQFGVVDGRCLDFANQVRAVILPHVEEKWHRMRGDQFERVKSDLRHARNFLRDFFEARDKEIRESALAKPAPAPKPKTSKAPPKVLELVEKAAERVPPSERGSMASLFGA